MALTEIVVDYLATLSDRLRLPRALKTLRDEAEARLAALEGSSAASDAQADADAALAAVPKKVTVSISQAELAALGAGVKTFTKSFSAVPAAGARLLGVDQALATKFHDGGSGAFGVELGSAADPDLLRTSTDVSNASSGFPKSGTAGVGGHAGAEVGGVTLQVKLTSDVDLNTATQGAYSAVVVFSVPPAAS